ncbi:MAG: sensor domain-containing diguanylate cyclase [Burkholderiaceae bacterium]
MTPLKTFAAAAGIACAATLAASLLLALSAVAERLEWVTEKYDTLLDTVAYTRLASKLASVERELDAFETALARQTIPTDAASLATIGSLLQGFQQTEHHLYFYCPQQQQLFSFPSVAENERLQPEERPWFHTAVAGEPQARWTEPYAKLYSGTMVVSRTKALRADDKQLLGILVVDLPLSALQTPLERAAGRNPITLLIRTADGTVIASSNGNGLPVEAAQIDRATTALGDTLGALQHGLVRRQQLDEPTWEVLLYLPPTSTQELLRQELHRHVAPMLGLLLALLLAVGLLAQRFWRERQLLADALDALNRDQRPPASQPPQHFWLMDEPLRAMHRLARQVTDDRHQARHDALTNIPNRRAFETDLDLKLACHARFGLLSFDLDHFKIINDSLGHAVGDAVLRRIVNAILECHLPLTLYRIGGDEFAALLDDSIALDPRCQALLQRVRSLAWREAGIHLTISIGGVHSHEASRRDDLLALCDARLYRSKQSGRDRVTLSGEAAAPPTACVND